jgi:S1-C subfamily serine protease
MKPIRCRFLHPHVVATAVLLLNVTALPAQVAPAVGRIAPASRTLTTSNIAALATPATVTILTFGPHGDTLGQGSGFLVRANGVVVTNWHVMAGASEAVVYLADGERFTRVQALDGDETVDVALLKVPGYGLPTLTSTAATPTIGTKVVAIGSPRGLAQTVTEGIVSAKRIVEGRELVQISASISPGSSGGPVLDNKGRVFAIATSQISDGQQLNFAVPVRYALGLIPEVLRTRTLAELFVRSPAATAAQSRMPETVPVDAIPRRGGATPPLVSGADDPLVTGFYSRSTSPALSQTAMPRAELAGFYLFRMDIRWPDLHAGGLDTFHLSTPGAFVMAADKSGYLVRWLTNKDTGKTLTWVQPFTQLNAAPDGRVVLEIDETTFSGYQTDEGIVLSSRRTDKDGDTIVSRMRMMAATNTLSNTTGLYTARARTLFHSGSRSGGHTEWTGDAAIVNAKDSVFIDLTLGNDSGGSTGGFLKGAIKEDGSFEAWDYRRMLTLEGTISSGILRAKWTDRRENGVYYAGNVSAARR